MDPATAVVVAAVVAAIASIVGTIINLIDRRKVTETHHQVTRNGGTSNNPTVLDKLANISVELQLVKEAQATQDVKINTLWDLTVSNTPSPVAPEESK